MHPTNKFPMKFEEKYMEGPEVPCKTTDVHGDGNYFYRTVSLLLGNKQENCFKLKEIVHDFTLAHFELALQIAGGHTTVDRIVRDRAYA
jgi:hypothetical protein